MHTYYTLNICITEHYIRTEKYVQYIYATALQVAATTVHGLATDLV